MIYHMATDTVIDVPWSTDEEQGGRDGCNAES